MHGWIPRTLLDSQASCTRFDVLRKWVCALLLVDWADRWWYRREFLYPDGLFSDLHPLIFSVVRSAWAVDVFLSVALVAYVAFGFSRYRMVAGLLSWIFFVSLAQKTYPVSYSGDILLAVQLFCCCFLPAVPSGKSRWVLPAFVLQLQAAIVYGFAAAAKSGPSWISGSAVGEILVSTQFASNLGASVAQYVPSALLSHATVVLEYAIAVLIFIPPLQWLLPVIIVVLHLGFELLMTVHTFSFVMVGFAILFLPDNLALKWSRSTRPSAPDFAAKPWQQWAGSFFALSLIFVQLAGRHLALPSSVMPLYFAADAIAFRQNWQMFAPDSRKDRIWLVTDVELKDGSHVDYFTSRPPVFAPPYCIGTAYSARWMMGMVDLLYADNLRKARLRQSLERFSREKYGADRWKSTRVFVMYQPLFGNSVPIASRL